MILFIAVRQKRAGAAALSPVFQSVCPTLTLSASGKGVGGLCRGLKLRRRERFIKGVSK